MTEPNDAAVTSEERINDRQFTKLSFVNAVLRRMGVYSHL